MQKFENSNVSEKFAALSPSAKAHLTDIRQMIFDVAGQNPNIGKIEETLKWGQISYLTSKPKSGTTIRLAEVADGQTVAIYVHCQTSLVSTFRELFADKHQFEGNRAIVFATKSALPTADIKFFINAALTYHLNKG
ncbi:MAG: DUF1801 domain-containing protein [Hyphomicrobiales bacterium]|nr:DUF1801 domain-containing protein [Hyphomicrobiales bacterium]